MSNNTTNCPHCGNPTPLSGLYCAHCGKELDSKPIEEQKGKPVPFIVIFIAAAIGFAVLYALFAPSPAPRVSLPTAAPVPTTLEVTYRVTGSVFNDEASITIENATGGSEQADIKFPWEHSITVERGQFVYLSAQNGHETGAIECEILINGEVWKSARSTGGYSIATCSGSAGED